MSLHPPGIRRERILGYGLSGAGKSSAWLAIAEWIHKTHAKSYVYLIDSDMGWDAMRPEDGHLDDVVRVYPIYEFEDYRKATKDIRETGTSDDWFVYDVVGPVWNAAKDEFVRRAFEQDPDEFYLSDSDKLGGDYGSNWPKIRSMYQAAGIELIPRFKGHVLGLTYADKVRLPESGKNRTTMHDSMELEAKYGRIGFKPHGEDKIAHLFHTELFFAETPSGYRYTTAKDRQRPKQEGRMVAPDFVMSYLISVAGWRP